MAVSVADVVIPIVFILVIVGFIFVAAFLGTRRACRRHDRDRGQRPTDRDTALESGLARHSEYIRSDQTTTVSVNVPAPMPMPVAIPITIPAPAQHRSQRVSGPTPNVRRQRHDPSRQWRNLSPADDGRYPSYTSRAASASAMRRYDSESTGPNSPYELAPPSYVHLSPSPPTYYEEPFYVARRH